MTLQCSGCLAINEPVVSCSGCGRTLLDVPEKLTEACNERDAARAEVERLGAALRAIRARAVEVRDDYLTGARHQSESDPKGSPLRYVDVGRSLGGPISVCHLWIDSVNTALGPDGIARSNEENRLARDARGGRRG